MKTTAPRKLAEGVFFASLPFSWAAKVAVDSGAPHIVLVVALGLTALAAVAGVLLHGPAPRWLDGWRLPLVLLALWELPAVYTRLGGDGFEYYVLARSSLLDHDLDLKNDFQGLGARPILSPLGQVTSRTPIGMALLWTPPFLIAHAGTKLAGWWGSGIPADGFSPPYQAAVTTATYICGVIAVALLELLLRRYYGAAVALLCALAVWLATPLHFYLVANPAMSHGASAFAATAYVVAWLKARQSDSRRDWIVMGCLGALMSLIRVQDAVLLFFPLADLLLDRARRKDGWRLAAAFSAPVLAAAVLQTAVWFRLWSADFVRIIAQQGPGFSYRLHVADVLFSPRHGLFLWTPLYLAAFLGWFFWLRRELRLALFFMVGFVFSVLLNASMGDWWGSDAFGQRRLLGLTPLFALGLGESVVFVRRRPLVLPAGIFAGLILWNGQLEYIYNSELVAGKGQAFTLDRLLTAQVDVAYRKLLRWSDRMPAPLWAWAYDALKGIWIDEGSRSLKGRLDLGEESSDLPLLVGEGWYPPQAEGEIRFRQSRGKRSWLQFPILTPGDFRVRLRARAELQDAPMSISLEVNGGAVGESEVPRDWADVEFVVPQSSLHPGLNTFVLIYSRTPRGVIADFHGRNVAVSVQGLSFDRLSVDGSTPRR